MKKFVFIVIVTLFLSACAPPEPEPEKTTIDLSQLETWPEQFELKSTLESETDTSKVNPDISTDTLDDQATANSNHPSVTITAKILDLNNEGSSTTDLWPDHTYRVSIVVEAIDNFADCEASLKNSIVQNVFFSIELPRFITARDHQSETYLGGEIKLTAATDAEYTAAVDVVDNVYRDDVYLYGTEQELALEPLACSAIEWSGLVPQDICRWIANPTLNSDANFYMTHQIGDMYVGESRTFSLDFRVVDAETHRAVREAEPFTIKLLGAYPASEVNPGPSVTEMKRSLAPIIKAPREGENYYLTFALPYPSYLREYLDASEILCFTSLQTLTIDQAEHKLYLSHELSASDIGIDYTQLVMDLPEDFPKVTDRQPLKITSAYWSTAKTDYPQAKYDDRTGIKFAYCSYSDELNIQRQSYALENGVESDRIVVASCSPIDFQLNDNGYKSGFLYLTYRISTVE